MDGPGPYTCQADDPGHLGVDFVVGGCGMLHLMTLTVCPRFGKVLDFYILCHMNMEKHAG